MILKKLKFQNIRSYKDMEIDFPRGATLLAGDIGAGKTSILLAIQFALFGLQPGQKGASILRQGESDASVFLEFEVDNNNIILERTLKKKKSITQEKNTITINNQSQELSTSEMKNKVIQILDYPKEFAKKSNLLYRFTVYTPQEEMKAIIQERPEIRLDTLRHIFGVDRYRRIKQNSQILLQKIKELVKIKEVEVREINILKEKLKKQTEERIQLTREVNNLTLEFQQTTESKKIEEQKLRALEEKIKQKQELDRELENRQIESQGKQAIKIRFEKEIRLMQQQTKEKIDFSEERLQQVSMLLAKHRQLLEESNTELMNTNSKISVLEEKKQRSSDLKQKIISLENCPTCFQKVGQEHKDRITKKSQYELEDADRELNQKIFQKQQLVKNLEKEKQLINGYEQDLKSLESDKIKSQHQKQIETKIKSDAIILDRTLQEINSLETEINQLHGKIQTFSEIQTSFETQKNIFEQINEKSRKTEITLAEKTRESEILKKILEDLEKEIQQKEKIRGQINYLRQLQDWLEEKFLAVITLTEKKVLAKLRAEFSEIFNQWFCILVSDSLSARLDEDFTPIISQQDYEIDYEFLSGGERTAVALAYRLALNQILNSLMSKIKTKGLLILDEPTDGFSDQQLDKMRDIFDQLDAEQLILVSHEQKIEGFVDKVIRIKKDGTSMVEGN